MTKFLALSLLTCLLVGCSVTHDAPIPNPRRQKVVKLSASHPESFVTPSFKNNLDSNQALKVIVRSTGYVDSEIISNTYENFYITRFEEALIRNYYEVLDRNVYQDWEDSNNALEYPFDFILEVTKNEVTTYPTGISLMDSVTHLSREYFMHGNILSVRVIHAKTGQIMGLINAEYVPCEFGCRVFYDNYEILDIRDIPISPEEKQLKLIKSSVYNYAAYLIKQELLRSRRMN